MATINHNIEKIRGESWKMFDEISLRYDFLNRMLSWGQDLHWRRRMGTYLPTKNNLRVLDVATGTADVPLELMKANPRIISADGIDLAPKMLAQAQQKVAQKGLQNKIDLKPGDGHHLPYSAQSFDVVTIAFGIRNMEDPQKVLSEMFRVLKNEGRVLVLEFSLPQNPALRILHLFYLRALVPAIGFLFSGHYRAYRYLNQTIETFPFGDRFLELLEKTGFKELECHSLMFGAATIYQGDKGS